MHTDESRDPRLVEPLDALRGALAQHDTPPAVEQALMAAFAQRYPKRRWYQGWSHARWGLAGGLGSAALALTLLLLSPGGVQPVGDGASPPAAAGRGAFIALETLERIRQEPDPRIVETEVARTALAALGIPLTPETAGGRVRAEMLVGADGQPLALRLSTLN